MNKEHLGGGRREGEGRREGGGGEEGGRKGEREGHTLSICPQEKELIVSFTTDPVVLLS